MDFTPQELSAILFYKNKEKDDLFKLDWEKTRIQTFFLFNIQLPKKSKYTYKKFSKDVWPFGWDPKPDPNKDPEEGMLDVQSWFDLLKKPTENKEALATDLEDI